MMRGRLEVLSEFPVHLALAESAELGHLFSVELAAFPGLQALLETLDTFINSAYLMLNRFVC